MSKGLLLCALLISVAHAEESTSPWKHQAAGGLNFSQVALKDWAQGGEEALSWTLVFNAKSGRETDKIVWNSTYKFAFGQTKLGDQGVRKTDDKIDLETVLTYKAGATVNPYFGATVKTQFASGYQYEDFGKVGVSQFFDPAYLTQSAGAGYKPVEEVEVRVGLALREIATRDFNGFSDDAETAEVEKFRFDGGLELAVDGAWQLSENALLTSKLGVFAPVTAFDETAINFDNILTVKAGKYLNVNFNLQIIDDATAGPKTQIKETAAVGLSYIFVE